jgi:hypothetical protein
MNDDYRRFPAPSILSNIFRQRQPLFLQRNIRRALDSHERTIDALKSPSTGIIAAAESTMDRYSRSIPTHDMLARVLHKPPRSLTIHPKRLVKKGALPADADTRPFLVAKHEPPEVPTWLPPLKDFQIKCNLTCTITVEGTGGDDGARILYSQTHPANLTGVKDEKNDLTFSIDLNPFTISEHHLTQLSINANGTGKWKSEPLRSAVLSVGISCFNSEDASQLLSEIDPDVDQAQLLSPEHAELRATWKKLPGCPTSPLPLRRYQHVTAPNPRRSKRLDFLLDADISWTPSPVMSGTPLATCNRIIQVSKDKKRPRQAAKVQDPPKPCEITYIFDGSIGSRRTRRTSFSCVFCPDRLPHPTFDRLHFHYLSCHDHYTFKIHMPPGKGHSIVTRMICIELALPKYERASDNVTDEREISWNRPNSPFDLQRYLLEGGDNTWAGKPPNSKSSFKAMQSGSFSKGIARSRTTSEALVSASTASSIPIQQKRRAPEEVSELPSRRRKKVRVVEIPGVAIFRANSKRQVEPGEMISESDEEPDDSWLMIKHRVDDFPGLSLVARQFAILWDEHMQDEPISADVHVSEAVVRFTRAQAKQLRQPHLLSEFRIKLDELKRIGLISQEYIAYCLEYVSRISTIKKDPGSGCQSPLIKQGSSRMDVIMIDDSDTELGAEVSPSASSHSRRKDAVMQHVVHNHDMAVPGHPLHACVCGKLALGWHGVINCANTVSLAQNNFPAPLLTVSWVQKCPHAEFHMACVGLTKIDVDWLCTDCRPSTI